MDFNKTIEEELKKFAEDLEKFKKAKVKCGIIGRSGTGKSSLINAIAGRYVAKVDEIESTMEVSEPIEHKGLLFYDLPGASTEKFPKETYVDKMNISQFDCVLFVTSDRFYEDDLYLIKQVQNISIPLYLVRTKIDESVRSGNKRGVSEDETLSKIRLNLEDNLKSLDKKKIYLTSAEYPMKYDLNKLLSQISLNLDNIKKERFTADIAVTSKELLKSKRDVAKKIVSRYAALAAANGLNPIPGLDVAVDLGLLVKMANDVKDIFGLSKDTLSFLSTLTSSTHIKTIISKAGQFVLKYGSKEAIMLVIKKISTNFAIKETAKWIPLVGPLIAAGVGFKMTSSIGNDMIDDAYNLAAEIFESFQKDVNS